MATVVKDHKGDSVVAKFATTAADGKVINFSNSLLCDLCVLCALGEKKNLHLFT